MHNPKIIYVCNNCAHQVSKWSGQCPNCGAWNSVLEQHALSKHTQNICVSSEKSNNLSLINFSAIVVGEEQRFASGLTELDLVLGGGLVSGAIILLGGDPGIGKSTLLLQMLANLSTEHKVVYITGEESLSQVSLRAQRLGVVESKILLLAETNMKNILRLLAESRPQVVVIDSIQTIYTALLASTPGSVSQVRESAAQLTSFAKRNNVTLFLVGHVTKDGNLAGPRVLEHMVDTVLYFEGSRDNFYRMIRAVKNRFGASNELGIFAMTPKGLRSVANPSAMLLSRGKQAINGSIIMAAREGSRPLLVEVQALTVKSYAPNARRLAVGLDGQRLMMLLAILQRHCGIVVHDQDIFVNVVGGVEITETAADLPVLLAIISSLHNITVPSDLVSFGELGLAGELRPVQGGQERLREASKHGFKHAILPYANCPKDNNYVMQLYSPPIITPGVRIFKKKL